MRLVTSNLANYHATVQKLPIRQVLTKPMVWSWRFSSRQCVINKPAQQALRDCEFVQLNHPAYSPDLALSDYFLIRNLKCHLRGTWFTDDKSLAIAVEAWFESQNKKFYFRGINSWEEKLKKCVDVAGRRRIIMSKNDSRPICDIIC